MDTDIVFVVDESGSITRQSFQKVKTFIYNFCREVLVNADDTADNSRVGIIIFNSTATEHIPLNSSIGSNELLRQINKLPYYHGGLTNTAEGLNLMLQQSWRNDVSVLRIAIVITDGRSTNHSETVLATEAVHNHTPPIAVYAIGVAGEYSVLVEELKMIASGNNKFTYLNSFSPESLDSTRVGYSYQICFTGEYNTLQS